MNVATIITAMAGSFAAVLTVLISMRNSTRRTQDEHEKEVKDSFNDGIEEGKRREQMRRLLEDQRTRGRRNDGPDTSA